MPMAPFVGKKRRSPHSTTMTRRKRGHKIPVAIVGVFVASFLLLLAGIHQTSHLSSSPYTHDISFDPPVPSKLLVHGRRLNASNISGAPLKQNDSPDIDINITDKGENVTVTDLRPKTFPHFPKVQYLGVLIDAGRHYFPIKWLKDLVDKLHRMNYNFIHFRLTDDQAFNIRLESHPELAKPSPVNNPNLEVYSIDELLDFVGYANERNITVMPEINIPGHAGAWQGIPNLLVACPEFICLKGYGIPLNVSHPLLLSIIRDVITEVRQVFFQSPYLHLGGDEVEMSQACFNEAASPMFNYTRFEASLEKLLVEMEVPLDNVLRWEMTPGRHKVAPKDRAGKMTHYWVGHSYKKTTNETAQPFFVSQGLYFDSNKIENGYFIYNTAKMQASLQNQPTAIIGGTFELSTTTWVDRNVLGRLLAVAMGAAQLEYNATADFEQAYGQYCKSLGFDPRGCTSMGMPILHQNEYTNKWNQDWATWKGDICERLTIEHVEPIMNSQRKQKQHTIAQASAEFWKSFGLVHPAHSIVTVTSDNAKSSVASLPQLAVDHVGLVVDLVHGKTAHHPQRAFQILKSLIDDMYKFGFNLLQLRIMSDAGMAVKLYSLPHLAFLIQGQGLWAPDTLRQVIQYASDKGIQVMPEISIFSRAGGWANAGILAECPNVICDKGRGLALDTRDASDMQIFAMVLRELRGLFSSDYLHLGYDERKEAMECYREAKIVDPNLDEWEQRLAAVVRLEGISENKVLRWENDERVSYPHRAGSVTNYRTVPSVANNSTAPFFVTTNLYESATGAWDLYQRVEEIARASPVGIMAEVDVSVDSWDATQTRERLLTLAMGARTLSVNDEKSFQTKFAEACKSLGLKNCQAFASSDHKATHKLDDETKQKLRTEKLCGALTTPKSVRRPRKGVLVEA